MKTIAIILTLTACSSDAFTGTDGGDANVEQTSDASSGDAIDATADSSGDSVTGDAATADAPADVASDACAMISGATGCDNIMNAYCQALYNCNGGQTLQQCRAWFVANDPSYDCNTQKYKKQVCAYEANKCAGDIPGFFCGKLMNNYPDQFGNECTTFFSEFP